MGFGDGEIQTDQQLPQDFAFAAYQHGKGGFSIVGHCNRLPDRTNHTDRDLALFDQLSYVG